MRIICVAFALLALSLFSIPTFADGSSTVIDITATTCNSCFGGSPPPSVNIQAQLTLVRTTGQFFDSGMAYFFNGTMDEVVAMTGTINGAAFSLAQAPYGEGSWLYPGPDELGSVYFTVNGSNAVSWFENDGSFNLLELADANGDGYGQNIPITWDPVPAPEPASLLLLAVGLVALVSLRSRPA